MKICVLGSGSWGSALAYMLAKNGHRVNIWSFKKEEAQSIMEEKENKEFLPGVPLPDNVFVTWEKEKATRDCELFVVATPSKFVRATLTEFVTLIPDGSIIVNVSKGLEDDTLKRLSEVLSEVFPKCKIAVLSGPSHAEEVSREVPTTVVASSTDLAVAEIVQDVFMNADFRVYTNTDIIGVELGGALKNVIALAAGISDGMGFGDNTKAALMTRGIREIAKTGQAMGAKANTFSGLSGIGDLIVTCTSMHSRNRRAGILLGQGKSINETLDEVHMVVEGVNTSKAAYNLGLKYNVDMPITTQIYNVLENGKDPRLAVVELMTRDKKQEHSSEDILGGI